ncbi:MAG: hypothetical protein CBD09_01930 [Puniceicoccaceae bacterium TMED149]|jgi:cell division protein DivIC|nr:MAG: hypothetical protein CBD09_01930 [Puniceicoccaceae bacterium TMED149]|tara:strand:+ start:468 stop:773 length:306 start_codon:yes stop_codon:yes gene_type:complete
MIQKITEIFKRLNLWFSIPIFLLFFLIFFFSGLIFRTYQELKSFQQREYRLEQRLAETEAEFRRKEVYFKRLLEDDEFLERVARQRLGYARPDELIFRFTE